MLSNTSRSITYILAVLYAILGASLFALPVQLAPVFAWKVTPFMTMTIGAWCLGNAWLAFVVARRWKWSLVYPSLYYLWIFGVGELLILFLFRANLVLVHPIAWLYFITLLVNVIAAVVGIVELVRSRPATLSGLKPTRLQYAGLVAFIVFVGLLGLYGWIAQIGDAGTNGGIFPEIMSLFTLRSFGMFYLSLALAVIPLLWNSNLHTWVSHGFAAFGLILFITVAAFVYLHLFDFAAHPGGLAYFGAYLAVGIPLLIIFFTFGTGIEKS
ncbi:MAG TPA: hypothetical protein VFQ23_18855 [Anaerolineales bacterium]|nr:hypothetical protein [Anaerolineales bacterium]